MESDEFFDITLVSEDSIDLLNGPSRFIIADNDGKSEFFSCGRGWGDILWCSNNSHKMARLSFLVTGPSLI